LLEVELRLSLAYYVECTVKNETFWKLKISILEVIIYSSMAVPVSAKLNMTNL